MKPTALLVNTSRGPIVDESALDRGVALSRHRRRCAGRVRHRAAAGRIIHCARSTMSSRHRTSAMSPIGPTGSSSVTPSRPSASGSTRTLRPEAVWRAASPATAASGTWWRRHRRGSCCTRQSARRRGNAEIASQRGVSGRMDHRSDLQPVVEPGRGPELQLGRGRPPRRFRRPPSPRTRRRVRRARRCGPCRPRSGSGR